MKRREFLMSSASSSLALLLTGLPAPGRWGRIFAAAARPHHLVVFRFEGGWDVTSGPDGFLRPQGVDEQDLHLDYREDELLRHGEICWGPGFAPLRPWLDRTAVINGLLMSHSNVDHPANMDYMASGDPDRKQADFSVDVADLHRHLLGVIAQYNARSLDRIVPVTKISSLRDLNPESLNEDLLPGGGDTAFARSLQKLRSERGRLIDFKRDLAAIGSVSDSSEREALSVAAAFRNGLSSVAEIRSAGNLDTHGGHVGTHKAELSRGATRLATFLRAFQATPADDGVSGESLLDRTLFLAISEFSRTPGLNSGGGKDHNPLTNSALLIGHGVAGGRVWGQSRVMSRTASGRGISLHVGTMLDHDGRPAKTRDEALSGGFEFVRPGNVLATALEILKIPGVPGVNPTLTPAIRRLIR